MSITIIRLSGCPYSNRALAILNEYSIPNKDIVVDQTTRKKYDTQYMGVIETYPKIIYSTPNRSDVIIGGHDDLVSLKKTIQGFPKDPSRTIKSIEKQISRYTPNSPNSPMGQQNKLTKQHYRCLILLSSMFRQSG